MRAISKGVSLIELIVVLAVIGFMAYAFYPMISIGTQAFSLTSSVLKQSESARSLYLYLGKLFQKADALTEMSTDSFSFEYNSSTYKVSHSGTEVFLQKDAGDNYLISKDIQAFSCRYLARNTEVALNTENVSLIELSVTLNSEHGATGYISALKKGGANEEFE